MIKKPKFNSYFQVKILELAGVFLLSENNFTLLEGRVYLKIAPLINGNSTSDEIVEALKGEISPAEVYYALMQMERKSYIVETETTESIPSAIAEFCHSLNIEAQQAYKRLQETTVKLSICGQIPLDPALDLLQDLQVKIDNDVEQADIELVFTSDYLHPDLKNINQKALTDNRPWMLVKPIGTIIWIGPIFNPKKTSCWECLAQRLRGNRPVESFIQNSQGNSAPVLASNSRFPPRVYTGLSLAVHELLKWIVLGENERIQGCIVTFNT
ncbi:MAG: TOMM precursor leader peptide-binding protein, partial [Planktothrix sp.]